MEVIITLITYSTHGTVYNPFIRILKRNPDHNSHFTQTNLKEHHYISGGSRGEGASPSLGVSTVTGRRHRFPPGSIMFIGTPALHANVPSREVRSPESHLQQN